MKRFKDGNKSATPKHDKKLKSTEMAKLSIMTFNEPSGAWIPWCVRHKHRHRCTRRRTIHSAACVWTPRGPLVTWLPLFWATSFFLCFCPSRCSRYVCRRTQEHEEIHLLLLSTKCGETLGQETTSKIFFVFLNAQVSIEILDYLAFHNVLLILERIHLKYLFYCTL